MKAVELEYNYYENKEECLSQLLADLESSCNGKRKYRGIEGGAFDLVIALKIILVYKTADVAFQTVVGKYLEGLIPSNAIKELGEQHQKNLLAWFEQLEHETRRIVSIVQAKSDWLQTSVVMRDRSIALQIPTRSGLLFVVLNHADISPALIGDLPRGIIRAIRFLSENDIPGDAQTFQLYFDDEAETWNYLFAPTINAFGSHVDQYADLNTHQMHRISSAEEFIELFRPKTEDDMKLIVTPRQSHGESLLPPTHPH